MNTIKYIVVHCSATRENQDYSFEQLEADHRARGFKSCGYNAYIRRDGSVHLGRKMGTTLAHATGFNFNSYAICYEGGLDKDGKYKDTRTTHQKQAILNFIVWAKTLSPNAELLGHRDLPNVNKACPCYDVKSEYGFVTP